MGHTEHSLHWTIASWCLLCGIIQIHGNSTTGVHFSPIPVSRKCHLYVLYSLYQQNLQYITRSIRSMEMLWSVDFLSSRAFAQCIWYQHPKTRWSVLQNGICVLFQLPSTDLDWPFEIMDTPDLSQNRTDLAPTKVSIFIPSIGRQAVYQGHGLFNLYTTKQMCQPPTFI